MAKILIVENKETAGYDLPSYLHHENHEVYQESSIETAWRAMLDSPNLDLIFLDLNLSKEDGFDLLKRARTHLIYDKIPIVIYTQNTNRSTVMKVLNSGIQNYLIKPCKHEQIVKEVNHALEQNWRRHFFEKFEVLSKEHDYSASEYVVLLNDIKEDLDNFKKQAETILIDKKNLQGCLAPLKRLEHSAQRIGFKILRKIVTAFILSVKENNKTYLSSGLKNINVLLKIVDCQIDLIIQLEKSEHSQNTESEAVPTEEILLEKIESLDNLPPFGNLADAFKHATQEIDIDVNQVVNIINKDPCLASQVISFANSSFLASSSQVEDLEMAVQHLGYRRIQFIALSINPPSKDNSLFSAFDWKLFWMNQVGCAQVCQEIIETLNAPATPYAYLSGLLRGIGQIIMSNYFPAHYKQAVDYAHEYKIPITDAEIEIFGIAHDRLGSKYARNHNFPKAFENAIRYQHEPELATEHNELAAILNVALFLCNKYNIGTNGMPAMAPYEMLNNQPGWKILKEWTRPSFSVESFEGRIEKKIRSIRANVQNYAEQISYQEAY